MRRLVIGIFSFIVLFVLFVVLCTFVRRPYETVIIDRFGNLIPQEKQANIMFNWYLKLPTDRVVRIDNRLHLYTVGLQEVVTAGREPISIRTFAAWRIDNPVEFYRKTAGDDRRAEAIIDERIRSLVGQKMGRHTLEELFNNDETKVKSSVIEKEIAVDLTEGSNVGAETNPAAPGAQLKGLGLKEMGIKIAEIGFSRMAFPPSNTDFVYGRMVAELNTKARGFESEGQRLADTKRAEGRQEASKLRQEGITKAELIKGEGDREAVRILAEATPDAASKEFFQFWKQLEFLKASFLKNTYLVLPSDHEILKVMMQRPGPATTPGAVRPESLIPTPSTQPR